MAGRQVPTCGSGVLYWSTYSADEIHRINFALLRGHRSDPSLWPLSSPARVRRDLGQELVRAQHNHGFRWRNNDSKGTSHNEETGLEADITAVTKLARVPQPGADLHQTSRTVRP